MNRTPMRTCGKRWPTEDQARCSKRGLLPGTVVIPCALGCEGWHVAIPRAPEAGAREAKITSGARARKAPRYTGPDSLTRATVLERDRYACVCCGISVIGRQYSLQHRDARGMGGTRDPHSACPCNLVVMLGSAVTLCHGRVESNADPQDEAKGYALRHGQVPRLTPVMIFESPGGSGVTLFPTCDGAWSTASATERGAA